MTDRSIFHQHIDALLSDYVQVNPIGTRRRLIVQITNSASFYHRFKSGQSMTTATYERILGWFDKVWPEKALWPDGVPRPSRQDS